MSAEIATVEDVRSIVREEVRAALRELVPVSQPPLSKAQAAKFLGVSVKTITRRIKSGEIRLHKKTGRRVLVDAASLHPEPAPIARLAHSALAR